MGEAIPGVNVQALTAFFSKHIEPPKVSTQPRRKFQKNKAFSKLLEFSSKPDLTACKNPDASFSRSVSAFDLPNAGIFPNFAKNWVSPSKRKQCLNQSVQNSLPTSNVLNSNICASANSSQDVNYALDTASNDSGVDENSESSSGDSRQYDKCNNHPVKNSSVWNMPVQNDLNSESNCDKTSQASPTINIVIKKPFSEDNKHAQLEVINTDRRNVITTVWNRTYEVDVNSEIQKNLINKPTPDKVFYSEIVISDNYVCKAQYKRTELPSPELLGPPPFKPKKLDDVSFLSIFSTSNQPFRKQTMLSRVEKKPEKEFYLKEMQHINKPTSDFGLSKMSFSQDNSCSDFRHRTKSDISWKYGQPYQQQNDFSESMENLCNGWKERIPLPRPPILPPRRLSCPLQLPEKYIMGYPDVGEELYQDTEVDDDKLYEEVPFPSYYQSQFYVNHVKSDKTSKEISRLWQKEQRERVRQEKELEKLKKKFGMTGDEVPLDKGYIKNDAKSGRGDLAVKKGEAVLIMRIEDNPIGRLLVQNEKGKLGYVELNNLTVDADTVKSVMRERKYSMGSKDGRYSNSSNGEAIYEEC